MAFDIRILTEVILPVVLAVAVGYGFGRYFEPELTSYTRLSIYVLIPSLLFDNLTSSALSLADLGQLALLILCVTVVLLMIAWLVARPFGALGRSTQSAMMLSVVLVNTGNLGLSIITFAFGQEAIPKAVVIVALSSIVTTTVGVFLSSRGRLSSGAALLKVFRTPLMWSMLSALAVNLFTIELPVAITRAAHLVGQASIPLLLLLLGMQLARASLREQIGPRWRALLAVVSTRLIIAPLVVALMTALLGFSGVERYALVVQLAMPTAVNAAVVAAEFGGDAEFVSSAVVLSTLASLVTMTILLSLVPLGG
jgi:hypothetical protein